MLSAWWFARLLILHAMYCLVIATSMISAYAKFKLHQSPFNKKKKKGSNKSRCFWAILMTVLLTSEVNVKDNALLSNHEKPPSGFSNSLDLVFFFPPLNYLQKHYFSSDSCCFLFLYYLFFLGQETFGSINWN